MSNYDPSGNRAMRLIAIVIMSLLFPVLLLAQNYVFGPNVRVSDDPPGIQAHRLTSPGQHLIACRGDTVYVVWTDGRDGGIYFARSNDGGQSFLPNVVVNNNPGCQGDIPGLAVDDSGVIHVSWLNYSPSNRNLVYYAKSTNGGRSFLPPVRACDSLHENQYAYPSIAVNRSGRLVYIVRSEAGYDPGHFPAVYRVLLSRSTDGGATFESPNTLVCPDTAHDMMYPTIVSFKDTYLFVAWQHFDTSARSIIEIYFARSTDGGISFEPSKVISDTSRSGIHQEYPSIGCDSLGRLCVAFEGGDSGGHGGLGYVVSVDTGRSFYPIPARVVPGSYGAFAPSLFVSPGGQLYLSWYYSEGGYYEEFCTFSPDGGTTFLPPVSPRDSSPSTLRWESSITADQDGRIYVAWADNRADPQGFATDIYFAAGAQAGLAEKHSPLRRDLTCTAAPNPTSGAVRVEYSTSKTGGNCIEVIDCLGRRVAVLDNTIRPAGRQVACWNGRTDRGGLLPSGVYFIRGETPDGTISERLQLIRE